MVMQPLQHKALIMKFNSLNFYKIIKSVEQSISFSIIWSDSQLMNNNQEQVFGPPRFQK